MLQVIDIKEISLIGEIDMNISDSVVKMYFSNLWNINKKKL